ncbi:MAG TPA: hypothetical protein VFU02_21725, partial [Polyangiaceae bacterium]|nr:hypothetical protein [Polyangiaceae bacterium]
MFHGVVARDLARPVSAGAPQPASSQRAAGGTAKNPVRLPPSAPSPDPHAYPPAALVGIEVSGSGVWERLEFGLVESELLGID